MSADEKEYFKKGEKHLQTIFSPITFPFFDLHQDRKRRINLLLRQKKNDAAKITSQTIV